MRYKKYFFSFFLLMIIICVSFWIFLGKISYKQAEWRGHSYSVEESKKRNVFVKYLNYEIQPDSLLIDGFNIFIEKGFVYGGNSLNGTDSLKKDNFKYQICFIHNRDKKEIYNVPIIHFKKDIDMLRGYSQLPRPELHDTITLMVIINRRPPDSIVFKVDTVGLIKVWDGPVLGVE